MEGMDDMLSALGPSKAMVRTVIEQPTSFKRALPSLMSGWGVPTDGDGFVGCGCFPLSGQVEAIAICADPPTKGLFELQIRNIDGSVNAVTMRLDSASYNRDMQLQFLRGAVFQCYFTRDDMTKPTRIGWGLSVRPSAQVVDLYKEFEYA